MQTLVTVLLRFRTPLCVLYPPRITAVACYILAQRIADGPHSHSLDARVSYSAPSASLPTPPSRKPASPDGTRFATEFFGLNESELSCVAGSINILIRQRVIDYQLYRRTCDHYRVLSFSEFTRYSGLLGRPTLRQFFLAPSLCKKLIRQQVDPPTTSPPRRSLYPNLNNQTPVNHTNVHQHLDSDLGRTPDSLQGNSTPAKTQVNGNIPSSATKRLDLS